MDFMHQTVMPQEVLGLIVPSHPAWIVDCTVGGAGHAAALLEAIPTARLLGLDRDAEAIAAAQQRLAPFGSRAVLAQARFSRVVQVLDEQGIGRVGAVLADLGVSSHQLDTARRGFSFRSAGPLDMRMDPSAGTSAGDVVATVGERELTRVLRELGQERYARAVARAIVRERPTTTEALAGIVRRVVPRARDGLDSATRTFQALRIFVNEELTELESWLQLVPSILGDGGMVVVISFHSLEDRAVKHAFRAAARGCVCPDQLPVCRCGQRPTLELVTRKVVRPRSEEVAANPRSASARLRAARRLRRAA